MWRFLLSSLVLFSLLASCYDDIEIDHCPAEQDTQGWDLRAEDYCNTADHYHCLKDESLENKFYEFCSPPVKIDKGYYPTFNSIVKKIVPKDCPSGHYQPIKDISSHLLNSCKNKKSCDDTGQMICEEGDAKEDRLCMCNYMDGFARNDYYGDNPNKTEICCPDYIPCRCSKPDAQCSTGFELNAASQCVAKCQDGYYRPQKMLDCVKITDMVATSTQSSLLSVPSSTTPTNNDTGHRDGQSSDNTSLYIGLGTTIIGVLAIICIIIIVVAVRKGWCRRHQNSKKVDMENGNNWNSIHYNTIQQTTEFHINNAGTVQIGDNAVAIHKNGNRSKSTSEASEEISESEFNGFPRKSEPYEILSTNSLPGAVPNTKLKQTPTPTPTSTMDKQSSLKETYQKNLKALSKAAADKGLRVKDVPGDGNCMYNSALLQLKTDHPRLTVDEMRKQVQKFIESNPSTPSDVTYKSLLSALKWRPGPKSKQEEEYMKLQQNTTLEKSQKEELLFQIYLNEVRDNEWGDPFTLHALSQIYNVEIEVLSSRNLNSFTKTSVVDDPIMTIRLGHLAVNGEDLHYVALLPDDDGELDHDKDISDLKHHSVHKDNGADFNGKQESDHNQNGIDINNIELEDANPQVKVEIPHQVEFEDNSSEENEVKEPLLPS